MAKAKAGKGPKRSSKSERSTTDIDLIVGQRVRSRRLELNMSQERLADLLGVTFQQVQKYEKGVNRVAASRLFVISEVLGLEIGAFFEGIKRNNERGGVEDQQSASFHQVLSTPEGVQMVAMFAGIKSVKVRRHVVALVRALTEEAGDGPTRS